MAATTEAIADGKRRQSSPAPSSSSKRRREESEQALAQTQLAQAIDPALQALDDQALDHSATLPITAPWNAYAQPSWPAGERSESAMRSTGSAVSEQQTASAVASFFGSMPFANGQMGQSLYHQANQDLQAEGGHAGQDAGRVGEGDVPPAPSHLDQFTLHVATSLAQTYSETLQSQSRLLDGINALQARLTTSSAHAAAAGVGSTLGDEECLMRLNVLSSQISKMNRRIISSLKGLYGPIYTEPLRAAEHSVPPDAAMGESVADIGQATFAELAALPSGSAPASHDGNPSRPPKRSRNQSPRPKRQSTSGNSLAPIIPAAATPQAAVAQWLTGDPDAGLTMALKDWPQEWKRGNQIYCQRRTIYRGWEMSGKDWTVFTSLYGHRVSMAAKAVTKARIQSGEIKTRHRKRNGDHQAQQGGGAEGGEGEGDGEGEDEGEGDGEDEL